MKRKHAKGSKLLRKTRLKYNYNTPPNHETFGRYKTDENSIILFLAWSIFHSLFIRQVKERNKKMAWLHSLAFPNTQPVPWKPQFTVKEWLINMKKLPAGIDQPYFRTPQQNIHHLWSVYPSNKFIHKRHSRHKHISSTAKNQSTFTEASSARFGCGPRSPRGTSVDNQKFCGAVNLERVPLKRKRIL